MLVPGTTAEISLQAVPDFFITGIRSSRQNLRRRHDHSRRAITALQAVVFPETLLHRMQLALGRHALNGRDLGAISLDSKQRAGFYRLAIHQHGTSAAQGRLTADVSAGKIERFPEVMHQQHPWFNLALMRNSVNCDIDLVHAIYLLASDFSPRRAERISNLRQGHFEKQ